MTGAPSRRNPSRGSRIGHTGGATDLGAQGPKGYMRSKSPNRVGESPTVLNSYFFRPLCTLPVAAAGVIDTIRDDM